MKHVLFILLLFFSSFAFGQPGQALDKFSNIDSFYKSKEQEVVGKPLPEFVSTIGGKTYSNKDLKGKVVFLNMWFAACAPCMAEMDQLNKLYDTLKNNPHFEFISITFESREVIKKITKKYGLRYKVLKVPGEICDEINLSTCFPTSIIIGADGLVKFMNVGGSKAQKEIEETIFKSYYARIIALL